MVTAPIRAAQQEVARLFPGAQSWGVQHCRKVAGSSKWSQHAYGNAWDIGGSKALLDEVYDHLNRNRRRLSLSVICWESRGPCNAAAHADHIHIAGAPRMSGIPACAGGTDTAPVIDDSTGATAVAIPGLSDSRSDAIESAAGVIAGRAFRNALGIPQDMTAARAGLAIVGALVLIVGIILVIRDTATNLAGDVAADILTGATANG